MTIKKTLLTTGISVLSAFVLFAVPGVHAATNSADIINSGDGFDFSNSASTRTNVDVSNTNVSDVMQHINADVMTGGNSADRNIGDGGGAAGIMTGNATLGVGLQVSGNSNGTAISGVTGNNDANLTDVVNTGDDADVNAMTDRSTFVRMNNYNDAMVHQMGDIHAATGNNAADRNVGGAGIVTGNTDVSVGLATNMNQNMTALNLGNMSSQNGGGLNAASIVNTGDDMRLDSDHETQTRVSSDSYNRMSTMQHVYTRLHAGNNDSNRGIGGSMIDTGMSRFNVGATVQGNNNMTMFGSLLDALMGWF